MSTINRNIYNTTLPNGIKLISEHIPDVQTVTLYFVVGVGSRDDEMSGISHLVEHMAFCGTKTSTALELINKLQNCGIYGAYTSAEMTVYNFDIHKDTVGEVISVISDMLQNSAIEKQTLETEKKIVCHEIDWRTDNINTKLFNLLHKGFGNNKISSYVGGDKSYITNATAEDVCIHMKKYYKPTNTTIIATGNFDEDLFEATVKSKTKTWHDEQIKKSPTCNTDLSITGLYRDSRETPQYIGGDFREIIPTNSAYFALGFKGASYSDKSDLLKELIANVVLGGSGLSSPLMQEARIKEGLTYDISPLWYSYSDCGMWGITSATDNKSVNELIDTTIRKLKTSAKCIGADDVARARIMIKASLMKKPYTTDGYASRLLDECMIGELKENLCAKVDNITHFDVMDWLKKTINSPITVAAVGDIDGMYGYDEIVQKLHTPLELSA